MGDRQPSQAARRWSDGSAPQMGLSRDEVHAGRLLAAAQPEALPTASQLAALRQRLDGLHHRAGAFRLLRFAVAAVAVFCMVPLGYALVQREWPRLLTRARAPARPLPPKPVPVSVARPAPPAPMAPPSRAPQGVSALASPAPVEAWVEVPARPARAPPALLSTSVSPAPTPVAPAAHRHVSHFGGGGFVLTPFAEETRSPSDALTLEAGELQAAQQALHRDPAGAITAIDAYHRHFPQGTLRGEADLTELSADLALHRDPDALRMLDGFAARSYRGVPRAQELRLVRAELLSKARRFQEAQGEFDAVLLNGPDRERRERALFGRAEARASAGDGAGGRRDLALYLEDFPAGRFAARARQALGTGQ